MSHAVEQGKDVQLVVFRLADEFYGLDISTVQEIITWQPVTRVPRTPRFVEGIINLRGNVIPVIDLRKRFALAQAEVGNQSRIVVVEVGSIVVGLVVDGVSEVLRVQSNQIDPPLGAIAGIDASFIWGVAKTENRLIILLDPDEIVNGTERTELTDHVMKMAQLQKQQA